MQQSITVALFLLTDDEFRGSGARAEEWPASYDGGRNETPKGTKMATVEDAALSAGLGKAKAKVAATTGVQKGIKNQYQKRTSK